MKSRIRCLRSGLQTRFEGASGTDPGKPRSMLAMATVINEADANFNSGTLPDINSTFCKRRIL